MSAKVTFLSKEVDQSTANSSPKLTVPAESVVTRDGFEVVFLVREETATQVPVKIGERMGGRIEIKEGLMRGDNVILRPDPSLSNNTKVKVK
jgi:multidrug efflux pump subunit AcrA (membrane-fusion protein)